LAYFKLDETSSISDLFSPEFLSAKLGRLKLSSPPRKSKITERQQSSLDNLFQAKGGNFAIFALWISRFSRIYPGLRDSAEFIRILSKFLDFLEFRGFFPVFLGFYVDSLGFLVNFPEHSARL